MSKIQTNFIANIKFGDLTKAHQEILHKYFPVVEKEFLVKTRIANKSDESAIGEYNADVVSFLRTIEAVIGDTPPDLQSLQCITTGKYIIEMAVAGCRLSYRKRFRGYSYLTKIKPENTHLLVEKEAMETIVHNSKRNSHFERNNVRTFTSSTEMDRRRKQVQEK